MLTRSAVVLTSRQVKALFWRVLSSFFPVRTQRRLSRRDDLAETAESFLYNQVCPMATASPPAQQTAQPVSFGVRLHRFWRRVTEGLEVGQLWSQFESEARTSYRLYSRDVEAKTSEGLPDAAAHLHVVKEFFWAVFEKLSPARRVLLLLALILLVLPQRQLQLSRRAP